MLRVVVSKRVPSLLPAEGAGFDMFGVPKRPIFPPSASISNPQFLSPTGLLMQRHVAEKSGMPTMPSSPNAVSDPSFATCTTPPSHHASLQSMLADPSPSSTQHIWATTQTPLPPHATPLLEHYCRDRAYHSRCWLTLGEAQACFGATCAPSCGHGLVLPNSDASTSTHTSKLVKVSLLAEMPSDATEALMNRAKGLSRELLESSPAIVLDKRSLVWRRATVPEVLAALGRYIPNSPCIPAPSATAPSVTCFDGPMLLLLEPHLLVESADFIDANQPCFEAPTEPRVHIFNVQDFSNPFLVDPTLRHIHALTGASISPDDASALTSAMSLRGMRSLQWVTKGDVDAFSASTKPSHADGVAAVPYVVPKRDAMPVSVPFDQQFDMLPSAILPTELRARLLARVPPQLRGSNTNLLRVGNLDWRKIPALSNTPSKSKKKSKEGKKKAMDLFDGANNNGGGTSPTSTGPPQDALIPAHFIPALVERPQFPTKSAKKRGRGGRQGNAIEEIDVWFLAKDFDDLFGATVLQEASAATSQTPVTQASTSTTLATNCSHLPALRHFLTHMLTTRSQQRSPIRRIALPRSRMYYNLEQLEHMSFLTHIPGGRGALDEEGKDAK